MHNIHTFFGNRRYIFFTLFIYTVFVASFIQLILLPYYFPSWSNQYGLLLYTDSIEYHDLITSLANKINTSGWHEWQLIPKDNGHFIVGLSAIFYVLIYPEPWSMIPLNALVHVLSVIMLYKIALLFSDKHYVALLSTVPYMFFPSASFWFSQLLKDGYYNFGVIMFCYGWMYIVYFDKDHLKKISNILIGPFFIISGYLLMVFIRPFSFSLLKIEAFLIIISASIMLLFFVMNRTVNWQYYIKVLFIFIAVTFLMLKIQHYSINSGLVSQDQAQLTYIQPIMGDDGKQYFGNSDITELNWESSNWIPKYIDTKFSLVSGMRKATIDNHVEHKHNKSMIDTDILFKNATEIINYFPRAIQIAFFSPFPKNWLKEGSTESTTLMRKLVIFEMLLIYILFLFIPIAFFYWRNRVEFWIPIIFCGSVMTLYATAVPNIGAIYRYRYPYLMILITILIVSACNFIYRRVKLNNSKNIIHD